MALGEEVTAPVDTRHVLDTLYYVLDTLSISYLVLNIKCSVLCSSTTTKCNRTIIVLVQYLYAVQGSIVLAISVCYVVYLVSVLDTVRFCICTGY